LEAQFLSNAGRIDEAESRCRKTLEIDADYWVAHNGLGRVYLLRLKLDDSFRPFEPSNRPLHSSAIFQFGMRYAF
jgi:Flp pilus assembly protein TadD